MSISEAAEGCSYTGKYYGGLLKGIGSGVSRRQIRLG